MINWIKIYELRSIHFENGCLDRSKSVQNGSNTFSYPFVQSEMMVHLNRFNHQTKIRLGDLFMCFILNNPDLEIDIYALVNHEPQFMTHHSWDFVLIGRLGLPDCLSMSESDVHSLLSTPLSYLIALMIMR